MVEFTADIYLLMVKQPTETLLEQDLKAVREHARKREQREMDDVGVMLYNLKA